MDDYDLGVLIGFWKAVRRLAFTATDEAGGFRTLVELVGTTERTLGAESGVPSPIQGQATLVEDATL